MKGYLAPANWHNLGSDSVLHTRHNAPIRLKIDPSSPLTITLTIYPTPFYYSTLIPCLHIASADEFRPRLLGMVVLS